VKYFIVFDKKQLPGRNGSWEEMASLKQAGLESGFEVSFEKA
tara:strand:- start:1304 stop:1429 length:126 start_codon:yes stop_codon:yes gene_type:complete